MDIFEQINHIYTAKRSDWLKDVEDADIQPFLIQRFLALDGTLQKEARWLDKYTFTLPSKMWLSLAWSIVPKRPKRPYVQYPKKKEMVERLQFIYDDIRKELEMSDNDFAANKDIIEKEVNKDLEKWFVHFGVEKKKWKMFGLDFSHMKRIAVKPRGQMTLF